MSAPATPLSANEIRFYFTRAAVGVDAPFGIGEELAAASLWLAALGVNPASVAAPALIALRDGSSTPRIAWDRTTSTLEPNDTIDTHLSALFAGPAAADRLGVLAEHGAPADIVVDRVDQPALVLAAIATARPKDQSVRVAWQTDQGAPVVVDLSGDLAAVTGCPVSRLAETGPARITVTLMPDRLPDGDAVIDLPRRRERLFEQGIDVAGEAWDLVHDCFRKCLVPSNASSRLAGAGAGLTDND